MQYLEFNISVNELVHLRRLAEHLTLNTGRVDGWLDANPNSGAFYIRNLNMMGRLMAFQAEAPTQTHLEQSLTELKDVVLFTHYLFNPDGRWAVFVDRDEVHVWFKRNDTPYWIAPNPEIPTPYDLAYYVKLRFLCHHLPQQLIPQPTPQVPPPPRKG